MANSGKRDGTVDFGYDTPLKSPQGDSFTNKVNNLSETSIPQRDCLFKVVFVMHVLWFYRNLYKSINWNCPRRGGDFRGVQTKELKLTRAKRIDEIKPPLPNCTTPKISVIL
jgi:hypothetical protein